MTQTFQSVRAPQQFDAQLDSYWKSVAVYAVTLLLYMMIKGVWDATLQSGNVHIDVSDPVVVLLGLFVVIAILSLVTNMVSQRAIIVTEDAISFVSRFHERTFTADEIEKIVVGRERRIKVRGVLSMVKVYIKGRRRPLRIRPAVFENDAILVNALLSLKTSLGSEKA